MTGREKTYLAVRGTGAAMFILASTVMPRGVPAAVVAITGGVVALLTVFAVNAGGPGERAGARFEQMNLQKVQPPKGDWAPYSPDMVVDTEVDTSAEKPQP